MSIVLLTHTSFVVYEFMEVGGFC
uniref:Uncharacterized protein n=1 Tax=Anguilla anguilla TaxID=7936 RepID=A0A0E9QK92_ANGAN